LRDTIFCAIPEDADQDAITKSIKEVAAEVQTYVPGYRLLTNRMLRPARPVHSGARRWSPRSSKWRAQVITLPRMRETGHLTAAATKVGEEIAKRNGHQCPRERSMRRHLLQKPHL